MAKQTTQIPKRNNRFKPKTQGAKRLTACIWLIVLILIFAGLSVGAYFLQANQQAAVAIENEEQTKVEGSLGVKSIDVKGNTHYTKDQIISASGIYIGKSVWKVNKSQASARVQSLCPYVESAKVSSKFLNQITITVKETSIGGAIFSNDKWILVGKNGQGVDSLPLTGDAPSRYIYYKGIKASGAPLGKQAMEDRYTSIFIKLNDAIAKHKLTGICEVDMSDLSNITLNWKNQIQINLGSDSNIDYEIAVATQTLPKVFTNHGKQTTGTLDISSYSNDELTNQVIYTPNN